MNVRRASGVERGRAGSALVLSLVAVATVMVLAASFTQFASSVANRQAHAINRKRAFYLAEAGLAEAYVGLTCGRSGNVGTQADPALLGDGLFWAQATELQEGVVQLECTGMIGSGRAVLSLVAQRGAESVAALGMFSHQPMSVGAGSVIDGYDSSHGDYASQTDKSGAQLGSNEGVSLAGTELAPTVIQGDVTPGPTCSVSTSGSVVISGSTSSAYASTELPAVTLPDLTLAAGLVADSPYPTVIPSGESGYEALKVLSGSQVLIQGPATVVLGSLQVGALAELAFDTTNGPIRLYVTDACSLAAKSLLSSSSTRPEEVWIQVPGETAEPVALGSEGAFHGVVYAPAAQVVVGTGFELFGALVADQLSFEGAAKVHFDRHLASVSAEEKLPSLLAWRIVDLGGSSTEVAADPFDVLGVDRSVLRAPSNAHQDQILVIDYYDLSNVYHKYSGAESSFDWSVVKEVIDATRDGEEVLLPRSLPKAGAIKGPGVVPVVDGPMI